MIRARAPRKRTDELASEIPKLRGPCIACAECDGLCAELIETLTLPDAVLKRNRPARTDRDA